MVGSTKPNQAALKIYLSVSLSLSVHGEKGQPKKCFFLNTMVYANMSLKTDAMQWRKSG
jgi:hypothetical protein